MNRRYVAAPVLVDLFSGCGGFSLGAHRAGFQVRAAFDIDPILTSSFAGNFPHTPLYIRDVSQLSGAEVISAVGGHVNGIFGGPPCQGFSDIGRRDPNDPRRELLDHYFRVVQEVEPDFFVMENVRGLAYPNARELLERALERVVPRYNIVGPHVWDASAFGAATKRSRLFIIGVHTKRGFPFSSADIMSQQKPAATVADAIGDLGKAVFVRDINGFDTWQLDASLSLSPYANELVAGDRRFTGHRATKHTKAVEQRFASVVPGEIDPVGRHPRLDWQGLCPTLRAGTGADRGSYQAVRPIHPEYPRVITVREAARLQGFPDAHIFHPTVWHSYRMIGNSVSPLIAEAIFRAVLKAGYYSEILSAEA